ncbi:MAG: cytochrome P450 [Burkholderiales bacterium]|nr:cytochrome P450 [Burkholderiales bacterium]
MQDTTMALAPAPWLGLPALRRWQQDMLGELTRLQAEQGDLCLSRIGPRRVVGVFEPGLARALLVEHADRLERWDRVPRVMARYHGARSLLVSEGEAWRRLRHGLTPALAPRALAPLGEGIAQLAQDAIRGAQADDAAQAAIDIDRLFTRLTMRIIDRTLFGPCVGALPPHAEPPWDAVSQAVRLLAGDAMRALFRPWRRPRWWPGRAAAAARQAQHLVDATVQAGLDRWARAPDAAPLLALLPPAERLDNARSLFLAGHDTTAISLAWWTLLMAHHRSAVDRARAELQQVLGGRPPTAADLPALPWLGATLKEALRLYPPVPVLPMRRVTQALAMGTVRLPAGTLLRIAPWVLQRDARWWPQPEAFQPERFLDGAPLAPRGAWMPFGAGPRVCIGQHLALLEMGLVGAVLLQCGVPEPPPGSGMPPAVLNVTLRPQEPLRVRLRADGAMP